MHSTYIHYLPCIVCTMYLVGTILYYFIMYYTVYYIIRNKLYTFISYIKYTLRELKKIKNIFK